MRRCPTCEKPNPELSESCVHCGAPLPAIHRPPFLAWEDVWQPRIGAHAIGAALFVTGIRMGLGRALAVNGGLRDEATVLYFHLVLALACGLALSYARLERDGLSSVWSWLGAAVLGGFLSFGLDFLYTYQRLVYRLVWYSLEFFFPDQGSASAERAYGILQVLRFAGTVIALTVAYAWRARQPALRLLALAWLVLALLSRFWVRGAYLSFTQPGLPHIFAYALSVFFVIYGLSPRPFEARPAP